jgi:hypothetical protein
LSADGRTVVGENEEPFRTANRYRDIAIGPADVLRDGQQRTLALD